MISGQFTYILFLDYHIPIQLDAIQNFAVFPSSDHLVFITIIQSIAFPRFSTVRSPYCICSGHTVLPAL